MSRTYLATLQFDGSGFLGWQRQAAGRSVQAELERVLARLFDCPATAHAAGRTDAGVHALALGASFDAPAVWDPRRLRKAMNALLPADCWVKALQPMEPGFHARTSALSRRYRYDIGTDSASASPFRRPFEWSLRRPLALRQLRAAARLLHGEHDFRAFAVKGQERLHHRCRLRTALWLPRDQDRGVSFEVEADRFLHHMVRLLVGTMVDIGLGRRSISDIELLLERGDNQETSPPAPPQGLYFIGANYPGFWYADDPDPSVLRCG